MDFPSLRAMMRDLGNFNAKVKGGEGVWFDGVKITLTDNGIPVNRMCFTEQDLGGIQFVPKGDEVSLSVTIVVSDRDSHPCQTVR